MLVTLAGSQTGRYVARDGKTIGEWVPISDIAVAEISQADLQSSLTRQSDNGTQILLTHSVNDIVGTHVSHVSSGGTDHVGQAVIALQLTEQGQRCATHLTNSNALRLMAIVVGGEVRKLARLESPIIDSFTIRSKSAAESHRIAGILLGE